MCVCARFANLPLGPFIIRAPADLCTDAAAVAVAVAAVHRSQPNLWNLASRGINEGEWRHSGSVSLRF